MPYVRTPLFGGYDIGRSSNLADDNMVNLYAEVVETKDGKAPGALYMMPGYSLLRTIGSGPIRCAKTFNSLLYVVSGSGLYTLSSNYVVKFLGSIGTSKGPCQMLFNGSQIAVFDGVQEYVFGTNFSASGAKVVSVQLDSTSYAPGDTVTLDLGSGSNQPVLKIIDTKVVADGLAIVSGGTGGTPGPVTLIGTTGVGNKVQLQGLVNSSGVLVSVGPFIAQGKYTTNPSNLAAEPVTGGGLTGATIAITMGPRDATVIVPGLYTALPPGPVSQSSSSGAGTGATWTVSSTANGSGLINAQLPFSNPGTATYQDGFGIISQVGTNNIWQTNPLDLGTVDPLNFDTADGQPDNVICVISFHREIWVLKQTNTEVWDDVGSAGFAFQRSEGVFIQNGCLAPYSAVLAGENLIWLSQNDQGQRIVVMANGYQPTPISTHAIDRILASYSTVSDAIAWAIQMEGHLWYVIAFPTAGETWVYDATTSALAGVPIWCQWAEFVNGQFVRHVINAFAVFNGLPIIGDYRNGNLYVLNLNTQLDDGNQRKWVRSWRALPQPQEEPMSFPSLRIDMQTGWGELPGGSSVSNMILGEDPNETGDGLTVTSVSQSPCDTQYVFDSSTFPAFASLLGSLSSGKWAFDVQGSVPSGTSTEIISQCGVESTSSIGTLEIDVNFHGGTDVLLTLVMPSGSTTEFNYTATGDADFTVRFAVDFDNLLGWVMLVEPPGAPVDGAWVGTWNNDPTADPSTGAGGFDMSGMATPFVPFLQWELGPG